MTLDVLMERRGGAGLLTLNRPKALNALSLDMVRALSVALKAWRDDPDVAVVAIRGSNKIGKPGTPEALFGGFCAGGDIRFFHVAALAGDASLDDFFTEEYALNHLIHNYPKPFVAFMDGVVMGGGMGLSQGSKTRIVTEHTKMAMPETNIGLFPDVGGGYFLSRCPGHVGEYLALTGNVIGADEAIAYGLADVKVDAASLPALWERLGDSSFDEWSAIHLGAACAHNTSATALNDAEKAPDLMDWSRLEQFREFDDDAQTMTREIISLFIKDTPERCQALKSALASSDSAALSQAAHALKGSASNIGASAIQEACAWLEQSCLQGAWPPDAASQVNTVHEMWPPTLAQLQDWLHKSR